MVAPKLRPQLICASLTSMKEVNLNAEVVEDTTYYYTIGFKNQNEDTS